MSLTRSCLDARRPPRIARHAVVLAASVLLTGAPVQAQETLRLDPDVRPTYQVISLTVDPREDTYTGGTRIEITVDAPTDQILLHAEGMTIDRAELRQRDGTRIELDPATFASGHMGLVTMPLGQTLEPGDYGIQLDFTQTFNRQAVGLYKLETEGASYAFTQLQATDARKAFPCFDEPAMKARFELHLNVPEADRAFANTPVLRETLVDGRREYSFAATPRMSSYLVAMAIGPLEAVPIEGLRIPGQVVVPAGKTDLVAETVRVTPPIFDALEAYFGTPHPFEKLDLVAVPEFWPGAMENVGLITFRESILLLDDRASPARLRYLVEVIAHEIAHQWFGNLVTMEWWDDLWLNEAFATWIENKIGVQLFPEYGFDIERIEAAQQAMSLDAMTTSRAIRQPVESLASLIQSADILAYEKGQAVLHMFEQWMGPETFQAGVREHLARNAWDNATAADLFEALSDAGDIDVGAAMATFLDQPGVPLVRAEVIAGGKVRLSQERFLNESAELPEEYADDRWRVPVRLRFRDAEGVRTSNVFLTEREQTFDLGVAGEIEWIHPNADEAGYYRWSVPAGEMMSLAEAADEALSTGEGVGLVSTFRALLGAGELHGDEFLRAIELLAVDAGPEVLDAVTGQVRFVHETFVTAELEEPFAAYCRRLLGPALARYGYEPSPEEPRAVTTLRPRILQQLAEYGNEEEVRAWAGTQARALLADRDAVHPSLARTVMTIAARDGDREFWETCRERFEASTNPMDRGLYLSTLSDFEEPELIDEALAYSLSPSIRPQEVGSLITGAADAQARGSRRVYEWVTSHYDEVASRIPPPYLVYIPYVAAGCSEEILADAQVFFAQPEHSPPGTEAEMARVSEAVGDCVALLAREGASVSSYLERMAQATAE